MKKKFFTLFSATLATLALALLSSCSGITSPSEPEAATAHQAEGLSLRGTFSMANATAEPSLNSSSQGQSQRNAIPDIGDLIYSVKAYRSSDGATKWADVDQDTKSYEFRNTLSSGTWQITAYAKQGDITILQSETTTITLSKDRPDASANLALAPSTEGSGTIDLTVRWASGTGISWFKYSCPAFSTGENQGSGSENSFTLSDSNVAAGIYPITISFYKDMGSTIPLYSCTEYIAVYPELTTNQWTKSTAPHISSSGQFLVTADCVKTFVYRSVYLSSSGNDTTANGTSERPYKTVEAAMARLTELASTSIHSISEATPWELHVVGTITATSISGNVFIDVPSSIGFLKIVGEGSGATLDANEKGRVLYVNNGTNVTIKNITLQKGKVTGEGNYGGGVYVEAGGTFTMESGTITGCNATDGGGVSVSSGATFNMKDGTITGNTSTFTGGLTLLGTFNRDGGTITGNTSTGANNGNNIYIAANANGSFPTSGGNAFYDDSSNTNGKADAICKITSNQFARFNTPGSGNTDFQTFVQSSNSVFNKNYAATFYLGNTTDTAEKTWVASETIYPGLNLTITCASTANDVKARIKPSSITTLNLVNNSKNLTLKKIILQGSSDVRCIASSGGSLTVENSTLTGSTLNNQGAGLYLTGGSASFDGNSSVTACDISSHDNCKGGGIAVDGSGASLTFSGKIYGCAAKQGGGIYLKDGSVTLKDNAVIGKSVDSGYPSDSTSASEINKAIDGAGVYVQSGTFNMEDSSKVSFNHATIASSNNKNGGGIYVAGGTVNIGTSSSHSASVCNNTGASRGGGIYIAGGTVNLYGSVKSNHCNNSCGGVEIEGAGTLKTYSGSNIEGNIASVGGYGGNGVQLSNSGATLQMTGGSISSNQTYDVSMTNGSFSMSGNAFAEKTYIGTSSPKITIAGSLSRYQVATITLPSYTIGAIILELASSPSPSTTLAAEYNRFQLSSTDYEIGTTGKIRKKFDAITLSEITSKDSSMVDSGPLGASNLKGKIIYYKTSNGTYGLMQFINFPSTFYWKTGSGAKQEKYGFQSGWGFDLDGGTTTDSNKDFGIDSGNLVPHNGAKFYTID
jgi:hypothetical protein